MTVDKKKLVRDWFAAWNSCDAANIARFYTDDGTFEEVASGKLSRGRDELVATFKGIFVDYPDLKCEQRDTFYCPAAVCGEFVMSGTHASGADPAAPSAGKRISVRVGYLVELEKGKIKRHADYFDRLTIGQQLGLI